MQPRLHLMTFGLFMCLLFLSMLTYGQTNLYTQVGLPLPIVVSDKEDYAPGETAIIRGSGWSLDKYIDVHLKEDSTDIYTYFQNIEVKVDGTWEIYFLIEEKHLGVKFTVIAQGEQSGYLGKTEFTDGAWMLTSNQTEFCSRSTNLVTFNIIQTNNTSYGNQSYTVELPVSFVIHNPSIVSVTGNKSWIISISSSNQVCLYANSSSDKMVANDVIVFSAEIQAPEYGSGKLKGRTNSTNICSNSNGILASSAPTFRVLPFSVPPVINIPVFPGSTSISGTSLEANGSTIKVFIEGITAGTAIVNNNTWTAMIPALKDNQSISATVTGLNKCESAISGVAIVDDLTAPVPPSIAPATGECSVTVTPPTAIDNSAGEIIGLTSDPLTYTELGSYTITWTFNDGNGNTSTATQTVVVNDMTAPTITAADDKSVSNDAGTCTASVNIPNAVYNDNCSVTKLTWAMTGVTVAASPATGINQVGNHVFNIGTTTITYTVIDAAGRTNTDALTVTVNNTTPVINSFTGPVDPVKVGVEVAMNAVYTDNNVTTATIDWKDGNVSGPLNVSGSPFAPTHIYSKPGVYSVEITFRDCGGQSASTVYQYVVIYDPNAGFVTGGGWINSPEGAYKPNTALTGKANFGFVSKYEKGRTVPSGNTEFQFHAGNMNFKSTEYEWLVISGTGSSKAQYKGLGTINGMGSYGFMLTAIDGNLMATPTTDKFRIQIWDKNNNDALVYDNQVGETDVNADPTTTIAGGSIVIHTPPTGGKKTNQVSADATRPEVVEPTQFALKAFPNPSQSHFNVQVESDDVNKQIDVRVMDLYGRTIEVIRGAYSGQTIKLGAAYRPGIYFVEMIQGAKRQQVKLLKQAD